jgi:hypothetical protein
MFIECSWNHGVRYEGNTGQSTMQSQEVESVFTCSG